MKKYFSIKAWDISAQDLIAIIKFKLAVGKPGSRGALLPPSPLRTVRDSLPSHGSSPSKASLGIEATQ
jgi:hypothetical protein